MITRHIALLGTAVAALIVAAPALAADDLKLPRQAVELVAPPFVHPHEQATKEGPKIIEFKLTINDPKTYTKTWEAEPRLIKPRPGVEVLESFCVASEEEEFARRIRQPAAQQPGK